MDKTLILNKLKELKKFKSDKDFAEYIGVKQQVLANWKSRGTYNTHLLINKFTDVNPQWLLTGEGDMLLDNHKSCYTAQSSSSVYAEEDACEYSDVEDVGDMYALPFITTEIAQTREINIKKLIKGNADTLERRSVRDLLGKEVDFMQRIITNAMSPIFQPGDTLFLRFLDNTHEVLNGAIHLIDTCVYGTMVRQVSIEDGTFILRSANPDFKTVRLDEDMIFSVSLIVASLRTSFNMPVNSINNAEVVASLTHQHDKLIDEVIAQNKRIDSLVNKVIEYTDSKK